MALASATNTSSPSRLIHRFSSPPPLPPSSLALAARPGARRYHRIALRWELSAASADPDRWDVLGLGQAMVDFSGMVEDEFLQRLGIEKGTRKVVNHEERGQVLGAMDGCSYKAAAGGSPCPTPSWH